MVRPSRNNLHEFVAEENTCFFDICLPNYTNDSLRRITYFKELITESGGSAAEVNLSGTNLKIDPNSIADKSLDLSATPDGFRFIEYYATPPKLPVDFEVADLPYVGDMK